MYTRFGFSWESLEQKEEEEKERDGEEKRRKQVAFVRNLSS